MLLFFVTVPFGCNLPEPAGLYPNLITPFSLMWFYHVGVLTPDSKPCPARFRSATCAKLAAGSTEKSKDNNKHTHRSGSIATRIGGSKKAKHIELKHQFVQQRTQGGILSICKIGTQEN